MIGCQWRERDGKEKKKYKVINSRLKKKKNQMSIGNHKFDNKEDVRRSIK